MWRSLNGDCVETLSVFIFHCLFLTTSNKSFTNGDKGILRAPVNP